jgi:hypothetical protein
MKKTLQPLALTAIALWFCGCAASSIKQTWKSPAYRGGPVQKIAVLAVDQRSFVRQSFESRFVSALRAHGQEAMVTHDLLGLPEIKTDKAAAAARLRASGAEVILIVRLVDRTTYDRAVLVTPSLSTTTVYASEISGWHEWYSVVYTDMGVVWSDATLNICLDTSLFDLKTGQRLWSALTLTALREDSDRLAEADSLVAIVVKALGKDGLVRQ